MRASGADCADPVSEVAESVEAWRTALSVECQDLACAEEARLLVEERYLDGQSALFPVTAERWSAVREASSEGVRLAADVLGPISGQAEDDALRAVAMTLAMRLTDSARAATLGLLGDSRGACAVTARGLRA